MGPTKGNIKPQSSQPREGGFGEDGGGGLSVRVPKKNHCREEPRQKEARTGRPVRWKPQPNTLRPSPESASKKGRGA